MKEEQSSTRVYKMSCLHTLHWFIHVTVYARMIPVFAHTGIPRCLDHENEWERVRIVGKVVNRTHKAHSCVCGNLLSWDSITWKWLLTAFTPAIPHVSEKSRAAHPSIVLHSIVPRIQREGAKTQSCTYLHISRGNLCVCHCQTCDTLSTYDSQKTQVFPAACRRHRTSLESGKSCYCELIICYTPRA